MTDKPSAAEAFPDKDDEPTPDFWSSIAIPETPPAPDPEARPFMRGSGKRWQREAVRGLGHPSRAGEPHGLYPELERFVRDTNPEGDAA